MTEQKPKSTMKKVYCPKSGKQEWANWAVKKEAYRCCKCGEIHFQDEVKS